MAINTVAKIDDLVHVDHVLISVSDKTGLETLCPALLRINPALTIYSTGGTYDRLERILGTKAAGTLVPVSAYTGQPEMQGGLVKTLDFKIYLGLLSETYNDAHRADLERTEAVALDMVVCNLYPFGQTVARDDATVESARGNIDIGGPCMVRAAAKNYLRVASVTDTGDYSCIIDELERSGGCTRLSTRFALMKKAFRHTADYDTAIAEWFSKKGADDVRGAYDIQE